MTDLSTFCSGTSISFRITDGTGVVNYSQSVTIAQGSRFVSYGCAFLFDFF